MIKGGVFLYFTASPKPFQISPGTFALSLWMTNARRLSHHSQQSPDAESQDASGSKEQLGSDLAQYFGVQLRYLDKRLCCVTGFAAALLPLFYI
jgi:hypothetical protein